jgi:LPXTG-motif cell wall-anchored protein
MEKKMKTALNQKKSWKKTAYSSALLLAGVMAFSQSSISIASADDAITSVSKADCSVTAGYTVTLGGNFTSEIFNVWANDVQIPAADWSQSATAVIVKIPASATSTFMIRTYNGGPVLEKEFTCTAATVVAPPVTDAVDETEDGGLLPDTATNNYNYLVAGLGLALVGARGLLRRRSIKA